MRISSTFIAYFYLALVLTVSVVYTASSQNVGIGTPFPLNRLDINGGVTIGSGYSGSRLAPSNGLIIYGNTGIGTYNPTAKLQINTFSFGQVAMKGINSNSYSIGVVGSAGSISNLVYPQDSMSGLLKPYDPLFKYNGSIGGSFVGNVGLFSYTNKPNGIGLIAKHTDSLGYASYFKGNIATDGFILNPGDKYGGSVPIQDGLTVGNLGDSGCSPAIPTSCSFNSTNTVNYFIVGYTPIYNHYPSCDSGFCKSITNVGVEVTMSGWHQMYIDTRVLLRGTYIGSVVTGPLQAPGGVGNLAYYTKTFNSSAWNGTDPSNTNWFMQFEYINASGGRWDQYNVTISYDFDDADSGTASYAAYGEIKASGNLYANSSSEYGDLAEFFDVNSNDGGRIPEIGDIVSISPTKSETFELSTKANDPNLAGVISENPSVYLNSPDKGMPIALSGRVRVKVNTEGGSIKVGDPITSSSTVGIGMKSIESGMVIGHALQAFDGSRADEGKIWILLGKTHFERVKDHITIVHGDDFKVGGVDISGVQKIQKSQNEIFIPWKDEVKSRIKNSDIDFDALTVDLNPFGNADLFVKDVDNDGVLVGVLKKNRSKDFNKFHYSIKLIDPTLFGMDAQNNLDNNSGLQTHSTYNGMNFNQRVSSAIDIYNQFSQSFDDLLKISELEEEFLNTTFNISKDEFTPLMNKMKENAPEQFEKYLSLGNSLNSVIAGDTKIMSAIHTSEKE